MVYLAENLEDQPIVIEKIGSNIGVKPTSLQPVIHKLIKHYLIYARKGYHGGITLNKPVRDIRIIDIVFAIERPNLEINNCVRGPMNCSRSFTCFFHCIHHLIHKKMDLLIGHENLENLINQKNISPK